MTKELRDIPKELRPAHVMGLVLGTVEEEKITITPAVKKWSKHFDVHTSTIWKYRERYEKNINQ